MKPRGFAVLSPERRRELASLGGKSVQPDRRAFSRDRALAASAGAIGGANVSPLKRSFFKDRDLAARAGRKGGRAS